MKFKPFLGIAAVLFFFACETAVYNHEDLIGAWKGAGWTLEDGESRPVEGLTFTFYETGSYEAGYGAGSENGTFRLEGDKLYTTEEGKLEKMVKIVQLTPDTLAFEMNRMGTLEKMVLVRGE